MITFDLNNHPHTRKNILTGEWILVSPHRGNRPWEGQIETLEKEHRPRYDPDCYLCPGNLRASGQKNPQYQHSFVFDNDFSALQPDIPAGELENESLLVAKSERGICRVICFSPRHDVTLPQMEAAEIRQVVDLWTEEYQTLGKEPYINYVQIFENKGAMMGCSNPHPHGQIWAQETVPVEPAKESVKMLEYYRLQKESVLKDYLELELAEKERLVLQNDHFVALVPFWAHLAIRNHDH